MRSFLATLFPAAAAAAARTTRVRLGVELMEDRYAPALVTNPLLIRGFNPQPDPPVTSTVLVGETTRGIVVVGG